MHKPKELEPETEFPHRQRPPNELESELVPKGGGIFFPERTVELGEAMLGMFQQRTGTFARDTVHELPVDYYVGTVPHHEIEKRRKENKQARKSRKKNR